ncbi:MAG: hypothetical protein O8C66_11935 [Candidatus Methanoperedens sp.]|nr:hypothetical protein [Candidatus Methanoperedens sp.]
MRNICFVQQDPSIRIYMQAKALRATKKYKLLLICEKCNYDLLETIFDEIIFYGFIKNKDNNFLSRSCNFAFNKVINYGEKKLKSIVNNIEVDIFHAHAEPNNIPRIVIENSNKPSVFDGQDFTGITAGIENLDRRTREDEKYCFEHAEGICHKGPQSELDYYRQHGYKIESPDLQWWGCCEEELFADINTKKLSEEDGEIHLVYIGSVSTDPKYEYKNFIPLIKELAKQKIHLDIYPSNPLEYRKATDYIELEKKVHYFHFHKHILYNELSKEIAKYDWGIDIVKNIQGERLTDEKAKVAMGAKFFGYLEAGIPVIVSHHYTLIKDFVETNQIGFSVKDTEIDQIGEMIKTYDPMKLKENIIKTREIFLSGHQGKSLEEFYQKIIIRSGEKYVSG